MNQSRRSPRRVGPAGLARRVRGASLIEVLVSSLIVSIGLLAMASVLMTASRYNKTTEFRSVATLLASDIGDRMRANKTVALTGGYNLTAAYPDPAALAASADPGSDPACVVSTNCTAAELAAIDLNQWRRALFFGLPGGRGYVVADNALNAVDVWVAWSDPEAGADTALAVNSCPANFDTDADPKPRCMYFRIAL